MSRPRKQRGVIAGLAALGGTLALVIGLGVFTGAGIAASKLAPANTTPPTQTGTPQEGQKLTGANGTWANKPTDFNYFWTRCDKSGGSCANISGATSVTYTLTSADVGNTLRFKVQAVNADGQTSASSVPTAVITAATAPPPAPAPSATGCPKASGTAQVADVSLPARLIVDQQQSDPAVVARDTTQVIVRYHVSDTCGHPVQGALIYATVVPFNQFSIPNEQATDANGWAQVEFRPMAGFPVSPKQQVLAIFVRARKSGENILAGISGRRLFSIRVGL